MLGRPIPEAMFNYARSDTHFLLYIYDNMRNELIEKSNNSQDDGDLIETVMECSKEEALQRYERPLYDTQHGSGAMGWYNMLCRTPALFDREQFAVFRAVHRWRDQVAREEDESVHVVMPKHVIYNIAREMPVDMPSLLGSSHPISKSFKNRKSEVLAVVQMARKLSYKEPDMKELMHTVQPKNADRCSKATAADKVIRAAAIAKTALPPQLQHASSRLPAQINNSLFWGSTVPNRMERGAAPEVIRESHCLALPMPQLTAKIFEDNKAAGANANELPQTNAGACAEHQYLNETRKTKADEIFIVKGAGGPLKRKATDPDPSPNAEDSRLHSNAAAYAQEHFDDVDKKITIDRQERKDQTARSPSKTREEKRAWRLESKRLKREGLLGYEHTANQESREVRPIDYANAPSVLHGPSYTDKVIISQDINPYTKSSDTHIGMRKAMKEQQGKSITFKG